MARDGDHRMASLTLLAAQTDFTEAGELQLFINDSQLAFLADQMAIRGTLDSAQMAGAFLMLRSNDLLWSRAVRTYLLGQRDAENDMMAWNDDGTRMPARMHEQYLRQLFLNNDLAEGRFIAGGRAVSLRDITLPCFVVGTETDHIAPWRSVYKIHLLAGGEISFTLTNGGHNAGIVSEPGHPHRYFRQTRRGPQDPYLGPAEWLQQALRQEGSWWPGWVDWLAARSGPATCEPPKAAGLAPAPGLYVLEH